MKGAPRSKQFDDVYFSADDGLAETQHVFLKGNNLPEAWQDKSRFVVAETGFGTGLNFLATWKLFEETAGKDQELHFISFEKHPLDGEEIVLYLQPWAEEFQAQLSLLQACYPLLAPGFHRIVLSNQVVLTLVFDGVNTAMHQLKADVDAWFLDGFKPSTNPDMWTDRVFQEMARLSHFGTTFATFTSAGDVRRGLEEAGFEVRKTSGFGRKRDMLIGGKL